MDKVMQEVARHLIKLGLKVTNDDASYKFSKLISLFSRELIKSNLTDEQLVQVYKFLLENNIPVTRDGLSGDIKYYNDGILKYYKNKKMRAEDKILNAIFNEDKK
jgi:hypothetical protein